MVEVVSSPIAIEVDGGSGGDEDDPPDQTVPINAKMRESPTMISSLSVASSCSSTASSETSSRRTYFQQTYHKNSARVMEGEEEGENEIIVATAITTEDVNSGKTSYLSHQDTMADTPEISESSAGLDENSAAAALSFRESDEESVEQATIDNLYRGDASGVVVAAVVQRRPSLLANLNRNSTSGGIQIVTPSSAGVGGGGGGVAAKQTSSPPTNNDDTSSATLSTEKQPPPPLRTLPVIMVRSRLDVAVLENAWIV